MGKIYLLGETDKLYPLAGDPKGQAIVRSDHSEKIRGFEGVVEEAVNDTSLAGGNLILSGTVTPTGFIHCITMVSMVYVGTVPPEMYMYAAGLAGDIIILQELNVISSLWYYSQVNMHLQSPDRINLYIKGSTAGDVARFRYCGYRFKTP